jgi:hypothetical protein
MSRPASVSENCRTPISWPLLDARGEHAADHAVELVLIVRVEQRADAAGHAGEVDRLSLISSSSVK